MSNNKFKPYENNPLINKTSAGETTRLESFIPNVSMTYPDASIFAIDSLTRNIALQPDLDNINFAPSRKDPQQKITGRITITDEEIAKLKPKITATDLLVMEGINRLWNQDISIFTPATLYRIATGYHDAQVTEKQKQDIRNSIDKMRFTNVELDVTAEWSGINKKDIGEKNILTDNMIHVRYVSQIKMNGQVVEEAYEILAQPLFSWYATSINKITSVNSNLLNYGSTTEEAVINLYVIKRISAMQGTNNIRSSKILFERIHEQLDDESPSRKRRQTIRNKVTGFLDKLVSEGEIKGYEITKNGQTMDGVKIHLNKTFKKG